MNRGGGGCGWGSDRGAFDPGAGVVERHHGSQVGIGDAWDTSEPDPLEGLWNVVIASGLDAGRAIGQIDSSLDRPHKTLIGHERVATFQSFEFLLADRHSISITSSPLLDGSGIDDSD